jgi:CheY-like chemotaxis protein
MNRQEDGLILFADDDKGLCAAIEKYLVALGYRVIVANDGRRAFDAFNTHRPQLIIADLIMPIMGGIELLEAVRKKDTVTPVIITTGFPEVETAIKAIQHGAYDYLIKPFQLELLAQKLQQALSTSRLLKENAVLSELASLHEITIKLTNTHDLESLLRETFSYCLDVSRAESGSIQLVDKSGKQLVVVCEKGVGSATARSSLDDETNWPVAKWVVRHAKPLLIANGNMVPDANLPVRIDDASSAILVPLCVADEVIGVIHLKRPPDRDPFSLVDLNIVEVLASQASIAINNAHLYESISQKLREDRKSTRLNSSHP